MLFVGAAMFGFVIKPWHKHFLIWRNCSCTSHIQQNTRTKCFTSWIGSNKRAQIRPFRYNSGVSSFFCSNNYWTLAFLSFFLSFPLEAEWLAGWIVQVCCFLYKSDACQSNRGFQSVIKLFLFLPVSCSLVGEMMSALGLSALRIKPSGSAALLSRSSSHKVKGWISFKVNSVWFVCHIVREL